MDMGKPRQKFGREDILAWKGPPTDGTVFVTENKKGETIYLTEKELKDNLNDILREELKREGINVYDEAMTIIIGVMEQRIVELETSTLAYFDRKLNKLADDITEKMLTREIEKRVKFMVNKKLKEIEKEK